MRSDYRDEALRRGRESGLLAARVGIFLMLLFIPLDYLQRPAELFLLFLGVRVVAALTLGCIYGLFLLPVGGRFPNLFTLVIGCVATALVMVMMLETGWLTSSHFSGLSMLMLTLALLVTWGPFWSALHSLITILAYFGITLAIGQTADPRFGENIFALIASGVLAAFASTIRERLQRAEFERNWSVAEVYRHKSEFFANVSHELRTPIHVMIGYVDMLLDGEADWGGEEGRGLLQRIRSQGTTLHKLVSDLLDSAKVEAGKMDVEWHRVGVGDVAAQLLESFHPLFDEKGLQSALRVSADLPSIVSEERKLRQILTNLLANALKFTERGEIRVEVVAAADIDAEQLGGFLFLDETGRGDRRRRNQSLDGVAILVTDTGIGIRRSDLRGLAQDYTQAQGADSAKYGGTGLGLSLSRKLVSLLGGRIAARSSEGIGSTFAVFLPPDGARAGGGAPAPAEPRRLALVSSATRRSLAPARVD